MLNNLSIQTFIISLILSAKSYNINYPLKKRFQPDYLKLLLKALFIK